MTPGSDTSLIHRLASRSAPSVAALRRAASGGAGLIVAVVLFEILRLSGVISEQNFPSVLEVARVLAEQAVTGTFWIAVLQTLQAWAIGLGLVAAVAILLGVVIGSSDATYNSTKTLIEILRPVPPVALIPLGVLVYGTGLPMAVFLVTIGAIWPLLIQTIYGVRDVDPVAIDTARAYGLGRVDQLVRIVLPAATPYIATGLRISSAIALILSVTAGIVVGTPGLGRAMLVAQSGGAIALMYALIVATGLLGVALAIVFARIERFFLHWHPSQWDRNV